MFGVEECILKIYYRRIKNDNEGISYWKYIIMGEQNMKQYFIMLRFGLDNANGGIGFPVPMIDENDDVILFSTRKLAKKEACNHSIAMNRGYQIYKWEAKGD